LFDPAQSCGGYTYRPRRDRLAIPVPGGSRM